ncbi:trehalose-6-phosphate hydrolase [Alteribacillus bidgolensis]|uniref:Trehalose-6-phosphate hydrolase n=1 Tax=Alteribacillus bidgolensis TaxID=930129 RepID=A0A1G8L706_9BACI|nr:trehalose-6-phosphate hydrolase [Alteribacillus bidgolensis]
MDVINLISKDQDFPNDDGSKAPGDGRKFYTDGPRIHEFMNEMNKNVFAKYDVMTVGEMSSTTIDDCIKYTRPDRNELNMTFNFHHLKVDYPNGEKWALAEFDFVQLKNILSTWQTEMHKGGGWNALFWCNHDQPRVVTRFGDDEMYHNESAKMLATTIHLMQGTPYIYQGEEFGMTNPKFDTIEEYRDVETLNYYKILKDKNVPEEEIMDIIKAKSRDNSRTPVQWNQTPHAGFTSGTPWISAAPNYKEINAEKALEDENSIYYHYLQLIQFRKQYDIITKGDYQLLLADHPKIFSYVRKTEDQALLVLNNFYQKETVFHLPENQNHLLQKDSSVLLSNYDDSINKIDNVVLRPYESVVYLLT